MPQQTEWKGRYYDGKSAVAHTVAIQVHSSGLRIMTGAGLEWWWPYGEVRQTQGRYAGEPVRLEHGSGICGTLVIPDSGILQAIHHIAPGQVAYLHNPAKRRNRLLLTILAGLAILPLLWSMFTWGIPWLAGPITALIPRTWEKHLGQFIAAKLAPPQKHCTDPRLTASVESLIERLTLPLGNNQPYSFHVTVVDSATMNALAAPGGDILVFRGLLQRTDKPEELAGVLAHEMQHILLRHGMRLLVQQLSMAFAVAALSGDASGIMTFGLQAAHTLQTLSYSRSAEEQADAQGMRLLLRAGVDPAGMLSFFEKLNGKHKSGILPGYLSTHPSPTKRLQRLRHLAEDASSLTVPLLPGTNWRQIRALCHPGKGKAA